MTPANFRAYLAFLVQQQGSQVHASKAWGISPAYLNDILQGRREPGPKLLQALGIRRDISYVEIAVEERRGR